MGDHSYVRQAVRLGCDRTRPLAVALVSLAAAGVAQAQGVPSPEAAPNGATSANSGTVTTGGAPSGAVREEPEPEGEGAAPAKPAPGAGRGKPQLRIAVPEKDGMLRMPGGIFSVGTSDKKAPTYERPPRKAWVAPFWIDRTEVTVASYRACVEKRLCPPPKETSASCTFGMNDGELPVNCVPFDAAVAFCRFVGKRLPREAEWEFAARGPRLVRFPWGSSAAGCGLAATLKSDISGRTCTDGRPARVGSHPLGASAYGVLDLAGNVEEWTDDVFDERIHVEDSSRAGATSGMRGASNSVVVPSVGASHVLRGGSWLLPPRYARTTARNWGSAAEAGPGTGFRCARDAQ
jgi:formylglycine-generating enzyme required for sulfatase activity